MQFAKGRMTAPERATAFAVEDRMHGFVRTDRGPLEAPRRASTPWILGCSSDLICMGCIRMQSESTGKTDEGIDEARGCRLTNIAPWTHTPISHPVHGIEKQLESKDGRMTSRRADGNCHSRQTAWLRASGSPTCGSPHHTAIPLIHGCQCDSHPSMKYKTTFADGIYAYVGTKPLETN